MEDSKYSPGARGFHRRGAAAAPGTCGELVQGTQKGIPFLVTCPVDWWSEVAVGQNEGTASLPVPSRKMKEAVRAVQLKYNNCRDPFPLLSKTSTIPLGKGMSSSTADIAAACLAASRYWGREMKSEEIMEVAISIEPSDGNMFSGIHLLDHRGGSWSESLGDPPSLGILVIDPGGEVDTLAFNSRSQLLSLYGQKEQQTSKALRLVREGIKENDEEKIGRGATISAESNQEILPKKELGQVFYYAQEIKAWGVNVAHSGTVLGIIMPPVQEFLEEAAFWISSRQKHWQLYGTFLIPGGVR